MTELKPCPFCGERESVRQIVRRGKDGWRDRYSVLCDYEDGGCGAESGWYHYEIEAIEAWNSRVENEKEREALTEIKELIDSHWGVDPIYYTGSENTEEAEAARLCCCINEIINSV